MQATYRGRDGSLHFNFIACLTAIAASDKHIGVSLPWQEHTLTVDFTHNEHHAMARFTHMMTTKITIPMIREVRGMFAALTGCDHHHPC